MKDVKYISIQGVKKINHLVRGSILIVSCIAQPSYASLSFTFNYLPANNATLINDPVQGFNDPVFGVARQSALNSAASMIAAYFVNYTANLTYDVYSYSANDGFLASAGSDQFLVPGTFQPTIVQEKIFTNGLDDGNGFSADGTIDWNFYNGYNWGLTDSLNSSQYDFKFVAMHELLHSFGFLSDIGAKGTGLEGFTAGTPDTWSYYDQFLTDASGASLISPDGLFDASKVAALTSGTFNAPGVLFNGSNAVAANNGQAIPIYSPSTWAEGSSLSHLDSNSTVTHQSIMNPAAHNLGLDVRTLGAVEIGILKDIGYVNIAAVPLPADIWLMLGGVLTLLGLNRKKVGPLQTNGK